MLLYRIIYNHSKIKQSNHSTRRVVHELKKLDEEYKKNITLHQRQRASHSRFFN